MPRTSMDMSHATDGLEDNTTTSLLHGTRISNFNILLITAILFGGFVVAEIIGALASGSLSLLGDAAAMSVDVFTYFANMYAERVKAKQGTIDPATRRILEVYVPTFSICALLGVTGWITSDAIKVIMNGDDGDDVNVAFLFGFASANFVIDVISSILFYTRKDSVLKDEPLHTFSMDRNSIAWSKKPLLPNLNMISALTHVGSDTMRTCSVFIAAMIATVGHQSSSLCDAWAAVVVSITIVLAVIPLIKEIVNVAMKDPEEQPVGDQSPTPDK